MATPLAQLVHAVMNDLDVRARFASAPESFLAEHGHDHLDAADLREAFFVLADGSAPAEATALQAGGRAMGDDDLEGGSAASALASALSAVLGTVFDVELGVDPAGLDDTDGPDDTDDTDAPEDRDKAGDKGGDLDDLDDPAEAADTADEGPAGARDVVGHEFPLGSHTVDDPDIAPDTGDAGIDLLDGLPDLDPAPTFDDGPLRQAEPSIDDGDGWDDVI